MRRGGKGSVPADLVQAVASSSCQFLLDMTVLRPAEMRLLVLAVLEADAQMPPDRRRCLVRSIALNEEIAAREMPPSRATTQK